MNDPNTVKNYYLVEGDLYLRHLRLKKKRADMNWISCKDKMPEDEKNVLIFVPGDNEIICSEWSLSDDEWMISSNGESLYQLSKDSVSHWQPLPSPPEDL